MQITDLWIRNFKSIRSMHIQNIENALILVGQNNTGKTVVLDALFFLYCKQRGESPVCRRSAET
jgi:AAA15 family ATPase/GTPase